MKQIFASADFGMIGLLFFFVFFVGVTLWTFRKGAKSKYDDHGNIPLKENDE